MVKRIIIFVFAIIIGGTEFANAQDPEYSQFYANSLYLNPAFAGSVVCPRISLNYRNQWPALGSTFVNYNIAADGHVDFLQGGVGLNLLKDVQGEGAIETTNIDLMYSYTSRVHRNFAIKVGFQVSYIQRVLNWSDLVFPDMIDRLYGIIYNTLETKPTNLSEGYFDFSTGFLGYNTQKKYYFGFAVHHLSQPEESFMGNSSAVLPRKYTAHFGIEIPVFNRRFKRGDFSVSPNIMYQRQQDFEQINVGMYFSRKDFVAGVWMRQNLDLHYDAVIMLVGFVKDNLKFSYSYDLTISKMAKETLGAHEVTLSVLLPCRQKRKKWESIACPTF
ncbi:MAG: PorP/SprF family type IX secretion system membrane protein [Bacteroidetes bacterium]|jgi:type IX secretion system PorP/SprF family membrane protein|nr:PorP/SprF family type IX secretion system membrane protein [Bacteroidota bacterium]MBT6686709.1 PorP/SprF family type IX secretion system membrane protein [Bacteroidota bacterium]MBT7143233.1 PorP/SprF family type IX secretion system membrane protein [Bacteroidota bacterium]MBT7492872.1 PorP/SprF family type IX secretion system membrane protein [Bacteroidota bacterium]